MITDKMIEAGLQHYSEGGCVGLDTNERREVVRDILEAAPSTDQEPVAYLRACKITPITGDEFESLTLSGKDHPKAFPVYAAPPSLPIKPLDWTETFEATGRYATAKTRIGGYDVFEIALVVRGERRVTHGWTGHWINGDQKAESFELAKAAAQADYEARILSALSVQAQDVTMVTRESAIKAIEHVDANNGHGRKQDAIRMLNSEESK